jgi:hypothetical protein
MFPDITKALGYQKLTSLDTVKSLTVPAGAVMAIIQTAGQDVRWRDDGSNPTATDGMLLRTTETLTYNGQPSALKFIEAAAGATIHVSYYREG